MATPIAAAPPGEIGERAEKESEAERPSEGSLKPLLSLPARATAQKFLPAAQLLQAGLEFRGPNLAQILVALFVLNTDPTNRRCSDKSGAEMGRLRTSNTFV